MTEEMQETQKKDQKRDQKQRRLYYLRGFFIRIIIACLVFLFLFFIQRFRIEVMEVDTDQILSFIGQNTLMP